MLGVQTAAGVWCGSCLVLWKEDIVCALNCVHVMKTRDIEEMEERYLKPLIAVMVPVARLSVESQVRKLYMKFGMNFHHRLLRNCLWLPMLRATRMATVDGFSQDLALKYCGPMLHAHLTHKSFTYIINPHCPLIMERDGPLKPFGLSIGHN